MSPKQRAQQQNNTGRAGLPILCSSESSFVFVHVREVERLDCVRGYSGLNVPPWSIVCAGSVPRWCCRETVEPLGALRNMLGSWEYACRTTPTYIPSISTPPHGPDVVCHSLLPLQRLSLCSVLTRHALQTSKTIR